MPFNDCALLTAVAYRVAFLGYFIPCRSHVIPPVWRWRESNPRPRHISSRHYTTIYCIYLTKDTPSDTARPTLYPSRSKLPCINLKRASKILRMSNFTFARSPIGAFKVKSSI